jgi:hypothetical protein
MLAKAPDVRAPAGLMTGLFKNPQKICLVFADFVFFCV